MENKAVNGKEYQIIKLLGKGKGGYSYLAENDGDKVVLKQIHHEPCDYYTFGNKIEAERNDYQRLLNAKIRIPKMLDIDIENERIIKEYIDGDTIFDMVKNGCSVRWKHIFLRCVRCRSLRKAPDLISIGSPQISLFKTGFSIISTMNAMVIWMNGALKTGALNTGRKRLNLKNI